MSICTNDHVEAANEQTHQEKGEHTKVLLIQNYQHLLQMTNEQLSYQHYENQQLCAHNQILEKQVNQQAKAAFHDKAELRYFFEQLQRQNQQLNNQIQLLKATISAREVELLVIQQERQKYAQRLEVEQRKSNRFSHLASADKDELTRALAAIQMKIAELRTQLA
ncbi:MAG: hypothetical protein ACRC17_05915 [Culicoidibacterales bacterium]